MKIAIDAREMIGALDGKGRYVAELIKALARLDKDTTYYLYTKEPLTSKFPKNFENVLIGGLPGLRQLWLTLDVKRRGSALLFAPTGYLPVILSLVPAVVTIHDLALFITKDARPALKTLLAERLLLGLAARKAKRVLAVSQSTKNDLHRLFGVPINRIDATLLGYDSATYDAAPDQNDAQVLAAYSLKPNYLLFIGTLEPRKNIVGLIRAYAALPDQMRSEYPLAIAGKKGWFYEEIFATVTALGLATQINFLGRVPDEHLPALYRNAKIFVFPSFYEGFGLPPLEALASGTPVITSNISSLPEVIGSAGKLVDPYDIENIATVIEELLTDPDSYARCKAEATMQAKQFSWDKTAKETLASFNKTKA